MLKAFLSYQTKEKLQQIITSNGKRQNQSFWTRFLFYDLQIYISNNCQYLITVKERQIQIFMNYVSCLR